MQHKKLSLIGYASGIAGSDVGSGDGPLALQNSNYLTQLSHLDIELQWQEMINNDQQIFPSVLAEVSALCTKLAKRVVNLVQEKKFFAVIGGDHSCAIGTWSGVSYVAGTIGLIWIDAHMDSHTLQTSETGNIHGMPVASLLGHGDSSLTQILSKNPKVKPENLCLIGIRSFESGEENLLKKLNVKVYYMDEVKERGLQAVFDEALQIVTAQTNGYGISIDIDSMDPHDAPGTGVAEPDGIRSKELCEVLSTVANDSRLLGFEIAEFDPHRDKNQMTEKLIPNMMKAILVGKT